jgi:hypothetical protein
MVFVQGVSFIVTLSLAALLHRKPVSTETSMTAAVLESMIKETLYCSVSNVTVAAEQML